MSGRIPEEKIEAIRRSTDIVDVISDYVQLKKQGRNFFGLCPFHGESTPSFSVAPDKQIYHCFGCGAGGNAFSFLMEIEGYNFVEAVQSLGQKSGIDLPEVQENQSGSAKTNSENDTIYKAHDFLAKLYNHCMVKTPEGEQARAYLNERGFSKEMIEKFQLGFAPDSWDYATSYLEKRNYPLAKVADAGLLAKREFDGKYFDRFRNRIMFPIWDPKGRPVAFGGRIIGEGEPKYLNSPETKLFQKGKFLYGFHLTRSAIRLKDQAILLEGYVDVITAYGNGVQNVVASLGTALTKDQAKLLRRQTESVVICYDSDKAGTNAATRAADELMEAGCYVRIAKMPGGLDPDDYIRTYGAERFEKDVIGAAPTVMAFKMEVFRSGKNLSDEGERIRYIEEVLKEISRLPNAVERDHYLRQLAEEFSLSLDALKQQVSQFFKEGKKSKDNAPPKRDNNARKNFYVKKKLLPAFQNAERILLAYMMRDLEVAEKVQEEVGGSFNIDEHSAIAAYLYSFYANGHEADVSQFMEQLTDPNLVKIASELAMMDLNNDVSDKELHDYIRQVLNYPEWIKIEEREKEKKEAEMKQDFVQAAKIAMEILEMKKNLKNSF
ncbi:DNA primase [Guptibacillus hwajinpoensis]|uniref:DNA primase n=1 Tax=Guptibacillus hwajinpoensis TaxID=208199 RepID=UPI001CD560A0|nr:DNA primase [Pseudalkalibacillus hwajinpoensis]MCA0992905.1 DNA primase [Pseudalkalibacillus hwajinpoensis]